MLNAGLRTKPHVCRGEGQTDYKRALAYRLLGINPEDFQRIPDLQFAAEKHRSHAHIPDRYSSSGAPVPALALLEISDNPEAIKVRLAYLSVPESYRRLLPPEAFCHSAGISPWVLLEAVTVAAVRRGVMASAIVAAVNMPRVVQKTVEVALQDDGYRERMMLHKAVGFWSGVPGAF